MIYTGESDEASERAVISLMRVEEIWNRCRWKFSTEDQAQVHENVCSSWKMGLWTASQRLEPMHVKYRGI